MKEFKIDKPWKKLLLYLAMTKAAIDSTVFLIALIYALFTYLF